MSDQLDAIASSSHPLVSATFRILPVNGESLPADHGHLLHAWFMRWLGARTPALADRLHGKPRPLDAGHCAEITDAAQSAGGATPQLFSVSGLHQVWRSDDRFFPAKRWSIQATTIDREIASLLVHSSDLSNERKSKSPRAREELTLERCRFELEEVTTDTAIEPTAVRLSVGALSLMLRELTPLPEQLAIQFVSPTILQHDRSPIMFPIASAVFSSIHNRWLAAGLSMLLEPSDVKRLDTVVCEPRGLDTRVVLAPGVARIGFIGACVYDLRSVEDSLRRKLQLLAEVGYFTGVGKAVGHGLGRILPPFLAKRLSN